MQRCYIARPVRIAHNANEDGWGGLKSTHLQVPGDQRGAMFPISTYFYLFVFPSIIVNCMVITLIGQLLVRLYHGFHFEF